ncbi:prepilin-type N-terminal cleavage/methylation domain-containing protein [Synechococcus sp. H55.7]|uniref:type IV pilin protein n=1 Tax=unclassified Synechococcus TaxID=2626047 RepID=UPI0039C15672
MSRLSSHEAYLKRMLFRPTTAAPHGMTLIELLVVIVIVGILSAVAIPNLLNQIRRSRVAEAQAALATVGRASEVFRMDFTVYPSGYTDIEFGGVHGDRYLQDPWPAYNCRLPEVVPPAPGVTGMRWMTEAHTHVSAGGELLRCDIGLGDRQQEVLASGYDLHNSCNLYR